MSLTEIIPLVNNLSQPDKLSLFKLLAAQVPDAQLAQQDSPSIAVLRLGAGGMRVREGLHRRPI